MITEKNADGPNNKEMQMVSPVNQSLKQDKQVTDMTKQVYHNAIENIVHCSLFYAFLQRVKSEPIQKLVHWNYTANEFCCFIAPSVL